MILLKFREQQIWPTKAISGGFGASNNEINAYKKLKNSHPRLGIPDRIIEHGSQDELYNECFYDDKAIYDFCRKMLDHQGSIYEEVTF